MHFPSFLGFSGIAELTLPSRAAVYTPRVVVTIGSTNSEIETVDRSRDFQLGKIYSKL